jgi:hypothetical protein
MTVLGDNSKPHWGYFGYDGTANPNQIVELLTAPSKISVVTLGAWVGGWSGTAACRIALYAADKTLLGYTTEFTVANEGAAGIGNVSQYEHDLETPVVIDSGADFYVGITRTRSDAVQWSTRSSGDHYEARSGYPDGDLGGVSGPTATSHSVGAYVADYEAVAGAWVRRGGVWVQAEGVYVRRAGAWVPADSISVRRGGSWNPAG